MCGVWACTGGLNNLTVSNVRIQDLLFTTTHSKLQATETSDSVSVDKHFKLYVLPKAVNNTTLFPF